MRNEKNLARSPNIHFSGNRQKSKERQTRSTLVNYLRCDQKLCVTNRQSFDHVTFTAKVSCDRKYKQIFFEINGFSKCSGVETQRKVSFNVYYFLEFMAVPGKSNEMDHLSSTAYLHINFPVS